jgi:hypothetical protein
MAKATGQLIVEETSVRRPAFDGRGATKTSRMIGTNAETAPPTTAEIKSRLRSMRLRADACSPIWYGRHGVTCSAA